MYLCQANLVPEGESVLTVEEVNQLGMGLQPIHEVLAAARGAASGNPGHSAAPPRGTIR